MWLQNRSMNLEHMAKFDRLKSYGTTPALFCQVFGHVILELLYRLLFFILSPVRSNLNICSRINLVGILSCHFFESGILRIRIELELVSSIILASLSNNITNVDATSNPRVMVSPASWGGSMTRFSLPTQNCSAAAFRLSDIGHECLKGLFDLSSHDGTMRACAGCVQGIGTVLVSWSVSRVNRE